MADASEEGTSILHSVCPCAVDGGMMMRWKTVTERWSGGESHDSM